MKFDIHFKRMCSIMVRSACQTKKKHDDSLSERLFVVFCSPWNVFSCFTSTSVHCFELSNDQSSPTSRPMNLDLPFQHSPNFRIRNIFWSKIEGHEVQYLGLITSQGVEFYRCTRDASHRIITGRLHSSIINPTVRSIQFNHERPPICLVVTPAGADVYDLGLDSKDEDSKMRQVNEKKIQSPVPRHPLEQCTWLNASDVIVTAAKEIRIIRIHGLEAEKSKEEHVHHLLSFDDSRSTNELLNHTNGSGQILSITSTTENQFLFTTESSSLEDQIMAQQHRPQEGLNDLLMNNRNYNTSSPLDQLSSEIQHLHSVQDASQRQSCRLHVFKTTGPVQSMEIIRQNDKHVSRASVVSVDAQGRFVACANPTQEWVQLYAMEPKTGLFELMEELDVSMSVKGLAFTSHGALLILAGTKRETTRNSSSGVFFFQPKKSNLKLSLWYSSNHLISRAKKKNVGSVMNPPLPTSSFIQEEHDSTLSLSSVEFQHEILTRLDRMERYMQTLLKRMDELEKKLPEHIWEQAHFTSHGSGVKLAVNRIDKKYTPLS